MSIRADFEPTVTEFIDNLHSFATGDYLREEEKELWDQPFDPGVLPQLRSILEEILGQLDTLADDPGGAALVGAIKPGIDKLQAFNRKNADAVLEPEEKQEISELLYNAAAATGADDEALNQLPELD